MFQSIITLLTSKSVHEKMHAMKRVFPRTWEYIFCCGHTRATEQVDYRQTRDFKAEDEIVRGGWIDPAATRKFPVVPLQDPSPLFDFVDPEGAILRADPEYQSVLADMARVKRNKKSTMVHLAKLAEIRARLIPTV